jgi:DNA-binding MarR family transcriptional regulator
MNDDENSAEAGRSSESVNHKQDTAGNSLEIENFEPMTGLLAVHSNRYDLQILRLIRRIIRAVDIYSRKLKANYKLTSPQLVCLTSVTENEPTTASQIAKDVFLSPSTVVGILDRLEQGGLVVRERDVKDRRVVNVYATDDGKQVVQNAPPALQDSLAEALQQLPLLEQATITRSLQRIATFMEAGSLEAALTLETHQPDLILPIDSDSQPEKNEIDEKF